MTTVTARDMISDIVGADLVTNTLGSWPSFHDAEVVRVVLERGEKGDPGATLKVDVHAFDSTGEVDASGFFRTHNHVLVCLSFGDVADLELRDFNTQNVILELVMSRAARDLPTDPPYEVYFRSSYGMEAKFRCRTIAVERVAPWDGSR